MADDKAWNCRKCDKDLQKLRNCGGRGNPRFRVTLGDMVFHRCPMSGIDDAAWNILRRYRRLKLPGSSAWPGGIQKMPEALAQAFEIIEWEMQNKDEG
jgi:hypothetical protein